MPDILDPVGILIILGACVAGFVQGLTGFGFAITAMAFWAWSVDAKLAAVLVVVCSLIGQLMTIMIVRREFNFRRVLPFVVGGIIGVPIGAKILPHIDQTAFRAIVGAILTLWCPMNLIGGSRLRLTGENAAANGAVGFVGGILGGIGGFSGAAPSLWCSFHDWSKDTQRAVVQWFVLAMHAWTLSAYGATGLFTGDAMRWLPVVVPAMLIPILLGAALYARISDVAFRTIVLVFLTGSGIALLASSLPRLL